MDGGGETGRPAVIDVRGLTVAFGAVTAVAGLDLEGRLPARPSR